ncbi:MAG: hypothetical protein A3G26_02085 [Betaproteobacteria bacterium RIFCSPLOWO2_12_FULL_65_110]|nr:MAG: hypothetical protein A3G26_02085 [Betaproteobacteria bacterium RIFCSPLOWO2_12_FULL_65_110]
MLNKYRTQLYSAGGVVVVLVILVLANFVLGAFKQRIDLTDGGIYTLSEGTRVVIAKLESPVKIRFYFSQSDAGVPLALKAFGRRVEDLLGEFRQASGGKIIVEKFDPQPDSDAEDSAALDGVEAQVTGAGDRFYLGLSVSQIDQKFALPALTLDRERLLEYDLTRAIGRTATAKKPVIGVMTPLPAFGSGGNPMMGMPAQAPWVFISELRRDYNVKHVDPNAERIDDDIGVLLVIHPRGITEQAQYAIDQFVLRGGRLIAMLDAYAYFDQMPGMGRAQGGSASSLDRLLKAWGVGYDATKVVTDMKFGSGAGPRAMPTLLSLSGAALNADDVTTSRLGFLLVPFSGAFSGTPADGIRQTELIKSSTFSRLSDSSAAMTQGDAAAKDFAPSGKEYPLAIRLTGRFKTAFPEGRPTSPEKAGAKGDKQGDGKAAAAARPHLVAAKDENAVVLVGDTDFINDAAAVSIQEVFGQRIVVPQNGNLAFAQALVEQVAGDTSLISLRTRATATRPFTVIREMEARAQQRYLGKIKELEDSLAQAQQKLGALQKQKTPGQTAILSAAQQAELESFRAKAVQTRRELKEVRKELRADSEALEFWTKVANIAALPILISLVGLVLGFARRRKVVAQ